MSRDESNPFSKLAEEFALRAGKKTAPGTSCPAGGRAASPDGGRKEEAGAEVAEAALFLDAVRRIKPLDRKKGRERSTLAELLAAKMKEGGGGPALFFRDEMRKTTGKTKERRDFSAQSDTLRKPDAALGVELAAVGDSGAQARGMPGESFADLLDSLDGNRKDQGLSQEDLSLFAKAMRGVAPVNGKGRDIPAPSVNAGREAAVDPARALRDILEGRVEFALHHSDEYMEGFVMGVDPLVLARLRGGQFSPEAHVDLHGMNSKQAFDALVFFIKNAYLKGLRTLVIVTGRGKNSPDGVGVLRGALQRWLSRDPLKRVVLAFCTARPHDGGPGAVYVLLRKYKKSRGKIIWEYKPPDDDVM